VSEQHGNRGGQGYSDGVCPPAPFPPSSTAKERPFASRRRDVGMIVGGMGLAGIDKAFRPRRRAVIEWCWRWHSSSRCCQLRQCGRPYLLGHLAHRSDRCRFSFLVGMKFIGAAVVTRSNMHRAWTCWCSSFRSLIQVLLRVLSRWLRTYSRLRVDRSLFLCPTMLRIEAQQRHGGHPMWIPHGMGGLGLG